MSELERIANAAFYGEDDSWFEDAKRFAGTPEALPGALRRIMQAAVQLEIKRLNRMGGGPNPTNAGGGMMFQR
jgi:hypothetical protein